MFRDNRRFDPQRMFRPASVALLGSGTAIGRTVRRNLEGGGFAGPVYIGDDPARFDGVPDLALICDAAFVLAALPSLIAHGCRAVAVLDRCEGLGPAVRQAGIRALGPGSFGVAAPGIAFNATKSHLPIPAGRVALVSQSASLCRAVIDWAAPNGVGFSAVIGIGANADAGFATVLDWLARDPDTGLILLDIREIRDLRAFLSAARAAARLRPVVAIRAGTRLADPSGQADGAFDAVLRRAGIVRVSRFADLLAAAETLARARPARNEALAIATNALGPGQLAADAAVALGLPIAALTPESKAALGLHLGSPAWQLLAGGVAYAGSERPTRVAEAAAMLSGAPEVGGVVAVLAPTGEEDAAAVEALMAAATGMRAPLLTAVLGETTGAAHRQRLGAAGVPAFASPELAVRGFHHLVQLRRARAAARELPPRDMLDLAPDFAAVHAVFAAVRQAGRTRLLQEEALAVLAAYGLPTVPGRAVMSADDAVLAADMLGYPAVLKLRRSAPPGSGRPGAVALDLVDARAIRQAAAKLDQARVEEIAPGFLVQCQAGRARELRITVRDDAFAGPVVGVGAGHALAWDLPPLNLPLADALIGRSAAAALLAAAHDHPAADRAGVAGALVRMSQLLVDFPEIAGLDIDPLFADEAGVLAADAWIGLRAPGERGVLAIAPYPAELAERWDAHGEVFVIRPIRPEDAEAHAALFRRLSPEDVRFRFFSALRALSAEQVARMTQVDYDREMAFVAVREASGETVGACRLVREPYSDRAEFAILVERSMRGRGLAQHLMQRIIAWGASQGVREIVGQVLANNAHMLAFVRRLGFTIQRVPDEPELVEVLLQLDG